MLVLLIITTFCFSRAASSLSVISLLIYWLISGHWNLKLQQLKKNIAGLPLIVYFLLQLISISYTPDKAVGLNNIIQKLMLLVVPLVICSLQPSSKHWIQFKRTYVVFFILFSLLAFGIAFYNFNQTADTEHFYYVWLFGAFKLHPAYIAFNLIIALIFLADWLLQAQHIKHKVLLLLSILFLGGTVLFLSSRAQIIVLIALSVGGVSIYYFLNKKWLQAILPPLFIGLIIGFALYHIPFTKSRIERLFLEQKEYSAGSIEVNDPRIEIWQGSLYQIQKTPLGTGVGNVRNTLKETYAENNLLINHTTTFDPHNQFIHAFVLVGIPGGIVFCIALLWPSIIAIRKRYWPYLCFIVLVGMSYMTESMLERQAGMVIFTTLNSLLIIHMNRKE